MCQNLRYKIGEVRSYLMSSKRILEEKRGYIMKCMCVRYILLIAPGETRRIVIQAMLMLPTLHQCEDTISRDV